jgi:hypothetical protein
MKLRVKTAWRLLAGGLLLVALSCAKVPPPLTEVEGTVLLNDQPLPNAQVQFMPDLADFGAELNSTAITDEQGHFRLSTQTGQSGAVVAKHRVVVKDAPPPADVRGQSAESQQRLAAYQAKLKNRPIPVIYGSFGQTPLIVDVKQDQQNYVLNLKR